MDEGCRGVRGYLAYANLALWRTPLGCGESEPPCSSEGRRSRCRRAGYHQEDSILRPRHRLCEVGTAVPPARAGEGSADLPDDDSGFTRSLRGETGPPPEDLSERGRG